jgi:hypothetical protein
VFSKRIYASEFIRKIGMGNDGDTKEPIGYGTTDFETSLGWLSWLNKRMILCMFKHGVGWLGLPHKEA